MSKDSTPEKASGPNPSATMVNPDEVSLQDIDKILEDNDPGFSEALNDVRQGGEETDVEIESIAIDEQSLQSDEGEAASPRFISKIPLLRKLSFLSPFFINLKIRVRNAFILFGREVWEWVKIRPKEYLSYVVSQIKVIFHLIRKGLQKFSALTAAQKLVFFSFLIILVGGLTLISLNLQGRWVPLIDKPLIRDYTEVASKVWNVEGDTWVPLFQALKQPEHRYLFDKVVVNLRRPEGREDTNPMGLFEFYVELDSKETAIEVSSRKLELLDLVQRTVEGETYNSLVGEPGKQRLKNLIRQELNQVLHQGWVKDVYISNMVLKP